ncbi:uncharacterized protein BDV17DRAFT_280096 [Aspergillus undulatus]|uniref:uncharacterized protein n=1 Tax=Aspergillus undulatus TaxID=1810928 RepID=UPI003CCCF072
MAVEPGRCGAKLIVNYTNPQDSAQKSANIRNMEEAMSHSGGLDIVDMVCSNVGVVGFQPLGDATEGVQCSEHAVYSGSMGTIESFVRVMTKDCGQRQITVNAAAPGKTVTDMFHDVTQHYIPNGEKYSAEQSKQTVAHASLLEAEWVIRKITTVDGGAALV